MSENNSSPEKKPNQEAIAIELNPQEQKAIEDMREKDAKRKACAAEVDVVLKKFNATIGVNPNSPFGKPEIIISLR